ncbi:MAG: hypothetical protein QGI21_00450 [Candidatus Poseidoniaceae archaeon]|jgi:predicted SprT family Zn-dependent metalloprotease|nr:hypothetical protein [Candidatus Poseidoniaceae archaeon]
MVKPSDEQIEKLNDLSCFVIEVMTSMGIWSKEQLTSLTKIELGVLRRNATQRHGVTRWKKGISKPNNIEDVDIIDIHPELLTQEWTPYGAWVLHHEYIHALGYLAHDSTFRDLEKLWPSKESSIMGSKFTETLRKKKAKWFWKCPKCSKEYPRQKKGLGKYMCRHCRVPLKDIPIK